MIHIQTHKQIKKLFTSFIFNNFNEGGPSYNENFSNKKDIKEYAPIKYNYPEKLDNTETIEAEKLLDNLIDDGREIVNTENYEYGEPQSINTTSINYNYYNDGTTEVNKDSTYIEIDSGGIQADISNSNVEGTLDTYELTNTSNQFSESSTGSQQSITIKNENGDIQNENYNMSDAYGTHNYIEDVGNSASFHSRTANYSSTYIVDEQSMSAQEQTSHSFTQAVAGEYGETAQYQSEYGVATDVSTNNQYTHIETDASGTIFVNGTKNDYGDKISETITTINEDGITTSGDVIASDVKTSSGVSLNEQAYINKVQDEKIKDNSERIGDIELANALTGVDIADGNHFGIALDAGKGNKSHLNFATKAQVKDILGVKNLDLSGGYAKNLNTGEDYVGGHINYSF